MTQFDPQSLPVHQVAGEPALAPSRLHPDWLRQRFALPPDWMPEPSVEPRFNQRPITPAAVLVPLVVQDDGLHVMLTLRTAHLHDHAGQISFPGGRSEPEDGSPIETALREAQEEVGLQRQHVDVLGQLPEYLTGTGYRVTPVVALVTPPFQLQADTFEVAEIFHVPLAFLMDGANHQMRRFEMPGGSRIFYSMPWQDYFIWGATAAMLRNLYHFLRA